MDRRPPLGALFSGMVGALSLIVVPSVARAAPGDFGIGPVEYVGDTSEPFREQFDERVERAVERTGRAALRVRPEGCAAFPCLQEAASAAGVDTVLMFRVTQNDHEFELQLEAYDAETGERLAERSGGCQVCGEEEFFDIIPTMMLELDAELDAIDASRTGPPSLRVDGSPIGAALTLDGEPIGPSPLALELAPGDHELEIRAPDHATQVHRWRAVEETEEFVEYQLQRLLVAPGDNDPDARKGLLVGGWIGVALGVLGAGAGVALVVVDGRPHMATCGPEVTDDFGNCPNIYTTAAGGYTLLGLGLAAVGTGTGLLIHRRRSQTRQATAAKLRLGVVGLELRF